MRSRPRDRRDVDAADTRNGARETEGSTALSGLAIDDLPILAFFLLFCFVGLVAFQVGCLVGRWWQTRPPDEKEGLTGMLVGSILAMFAFLLAVTMGMSSDRSTRAAASCWPRLTPSAPPTSERATCPSRRRPGAASFSASTLRCAILDELNAVDLAALLRFAI